MNAWVVAALPWFQIGGALATAFAAGAAWRSANASRRTAAKADETTRRALEALGTILRPGPMRVGMWQGNAESHDLRTAEHWPGRLRIRMTNEGGGTAEKVTVTLTDTNGKYWPTLGPFALTGESWRELHIDDFVPACTAPDPQNPETDVRPTATHQLVVEFWDGRELLRWRQRYTVVETAVLRFDSSPPVPQRVFRTEATGQPERIDAAR